LQISGSSSVTLTCNGTVQDALYGKPLAGAKVTIWILAKPESAGEQTVNSARRIEAVTTWFLVSTTARMCDFHSLPEG
jgi:hypothetical protein